MSPQAPYNNLQLPFVFCHLDLDQYRQILVSDVSVVNSLRYKFLSQLFKGHSGTIRCYTEGLGREF